MYILHVLERALDVILGVRKTVLYNVVHRPQLNLALVMHQSISFIPENKLNFPTTKGF